MDATTSAVTFNPTFKSTFIASNKENFREKKKINVNYVAY